MKSHMLKLGYIKESTSTGIAGFGAFYHYAELSNLLLEVKKEGHFLKVFPITEKKRCYK